MTVPNAPIGRPASWLPPVLPDVPDRMSELAGIRYDPGNLRARCYVPEELQAGAPLVVVLHGCGQDAAVYDHGSGWSRVADRYGFALLYPEQRALNNPQLCFNWFAAGDSQRGMGEPASIRAMIELMAARFGLDRDRVFITGLSAGGAMAMVMLATYPEVFAAGGVIAGVPYGCASGVIGALGCMEGRVDLDTAVLAASVRRASPHKGRWPRLSVWHGSDDPTVAPANGEAIVRQWAALHGVAEQPARTEPVAGHLRQLWTDADGAVVIEQYEVAGMAHGAPLLLDGDEPVGNALPHMLDAGLSSTERIAEFFGLLEATETVHVASPLISLSRAIERLMELAWRYPRPRAA